MSMKLGMGMILGIKMAKTSEQAVLNTAKMRVSLSSPLPPHTHYLHTDVMFGAYLKNLTADVNETWHEHGPWHKKGHIDLNKRYSTQQK